MSLAISVKHQTFYNHHLSHVIKRNTLGNLGDSAIHDRGIISVAKDKCEESMETAPRRGFDRGDHLGNLFHHLFHGVRGWLANNDVKGFHGHDEAYRLMNGRARGQGVVHGSDENLD
jgi:hypothetical protein